MKFNEKIVYLRKKAVMTQEELASKLKISRQSISKWENGETEPEVSKIKEIAKIFNVSFDYLLDDNYVEDKEEKSTEITVNNKENYNKLTYMILFIASLFILIVLFIIISSQEQVNAKHRGIFGFIVYNWSIDSIFLKLICVVTLASLVISLIKLLKKDKMNFISN